MSGKKLGMGVAVAAMAMGVISTDAIFHPTVANAQALDRITQGIKREPNNEVRLSARDEITVSEDETQILPVLRGVVIVNSPGQIIEGGTSATGVEARGDVAPASVISAASAHVGAPVSLASLDRMTRDMVLAFRDAGLPVVNVVIPPQDVSNGVIQILAVVGRVGNVEVSGNTSNPQYYSEGFPLGQGDVVEEAAVLDHLRWKSRRFHRRVDAVYSPGDSFSATDLTFQVTEDKPWVVFFGADNTGSGGVGEYRLFGGFSIGDLWGLDHELSYQYTTSEEGHDALSAHAVTYTLPIWHRADLQLAGAWVESGAEAGPGFTTGESTQLSATVIQQLNRLRDWSRDARYGFEYKKSNSDFEFGGINVFGNETQIGQFFGQITGQRGDSKSATLAHIGLWWSPGGLFDNNTDEAFEGSRGGADANYVYLRAGADHTMFLPGDVRFNADIDFQVAADRLLPSEMMYLGGLNSVRGFDENAVRGDNGIVARFELQGPAMHLATDGTQDALRAYAFFDIGAVSINGTKTVGEEDAHLAGAGLGLIYQYDSNLSAELAYGWKMHTPALVDDDHDGQLHFRILTSF